MTMQGSPALFTLSSDMFLKGEEKITKLFPNVKKQHFESVWAIFHILFFPTASNSLIVIQQEYSNPSARHF